MTNPKDDYWLARPDTIRLLWRVFIVVLVVVVAIQFATGSDGHFGIDDWIGFGAVFGFFSCLVMVLVAKGLGGVLKRPEDYYTRGAGDD